MKVIHNKKQQQDIPYSSQISRSTNPAHNFIISILRRLEFLGLYSILKVLPSLGRRSSTSNYIKNNKTMRTYNVVSMCLFFVLILLILFPINIKFNKAEAAPNAPSTRDQYLNVTIDDDINLSLSPTSTQGTFNSASTNFSVQTNYISGYELSVKTPTSNNKLVNTQDNSFSIDSISSAISETAFAASGNTEYNNKWGYKPSKLNSIDNSNFLPSPGHTDGTVLNTTSCANGTPNCPDAEDNYSIALGARVDYNIPTGVYGNYFEITAVANLIIGRYRVIYDGNGADNPNGMGGVDISGVKSVNHYNVDEGDEFDLFAPNFKRDGYGFAGWSTDPDAWSKLVDDEPTNDARIYGPNETVIPTSDFINMHDGNDIITLYAVWAPAEKDNGNNPVYLQNWTGCSDMTATTYDSVTGKLTVTKDSITALTDQRDNKVYTIAKLADGNCWMAENLKLENEATIGNNINNSAITNRSLAQGYGGVFTGLAVVERDTFWGTGADNSLYTTAGPLPGYNTISGNNGTHRMPRYNNSNTTWNDNSTSALYPTGPSQDILAINNSNIFNNYIHSYGNYYTWAAAIADTSDYTIENSHTDIYTSICPAGWHLPYGNNGVSGTNQGGKAGGWAYLDRQMGGQGDTDSVNSAIGASNSYLWRAFPNNITLSGHLFTDFYGRGSSAYYWSTSAKNNTMAYIMYITSARIDPGVNDASKYLGFSVRCVTEPLQEQTYTIVYDGNGATTGSMYSDSEEVVHADVNVGDAVGLIAPNYKKDGYGFVGWSPVPTATVGGSAPIYGPNETITAPSYTQYGVNNRVTLYAIWMAKDTTDTMQTFNSSNRCNSMSQVTRDNATGAMIVPMNSIVALEDIRDGNVYTVAKLADGKCWMTENLRLDNSANITVSNTQSYNNSFGEVFIGLPESSNTGWSTNVSNNLYPESLKLNTFTLPQLNTNNTNNNLPSSHNNNTLFSRWSSYGNYYSWAAAVADTAPATSNNEHKANTSICPSGWHLPEGGDDDNAANSEFRRLAVLTIGIAPNAVLDGTKSYYHNSGDDTTGTEASNAMRAFPNNVVYSGYWYNSTSYYRGSYGYYWSSSALNSNTAYRMNFNNNTLFPGTSGVLKNYGLPVRCVSM